VGRGTKDPGGGGRAGEAASGGPDTASGGPDAGVGPGGTVDSTLMGAEQRRATEEDLARWSGRYHAEIIDGELVEKALPGNEHADAQGALIAFLVERYHRAPSRPERPGGWWILPEINVGFGPHEIRVPDLAGWRRSRLPELPRGALVIHQVPDWICEIVSPSNARSDLVDKRHVYQRHGVPFYWIVDPRSATVTVYRLEGGEYVLGAVAGRGERVRAEPFGGVELPVGTLFGDEPDD
jgi:Uma2 family endonuclease